MIAGGALLIGALIGYYINVSKRVTAAVMAFGSGVLISALTVELMLEAVKKGGLTAAAIGFIGGAIIYTVANWILAKKGARHRKRSGQKHPSSSGGGTAIAIGALIDGIPESIAIGLTMLQGGAVSIATVVAIFLSNVPEGMSSSVGMKKAGRSKSYIFGLWIGIAILSGASALAGYGIFGSFPPGVVAATSAIAAGAMLDMIANTMIPEAFDETHNSTGFIIVLGFLVSFAISMMG